MAKRAYQVEFTWTVTCFADNEDAAYDLACLYGRDEAGLGEAFDKLSNDDNCVTDITDDSWSLMEFINPEDEPEDGE